MTRFAVFIFLILAASATPVLAAKWLRVDPSDPFGDKGVFHHFDIDSAFEDRKTGYVAARLIYQTPASIAAAKVSQWYLWAYDCTAKNVFYVGSPSDKGGTAVAADWQKKPESVAQPVMGGVTNKLGDKLCALKGSWPMGDLP